jgi:ferric-dicitrate binding protein FerR (iron transport regulator)
MSDQRFHISKLIVRYLRDELGDGEKRELEQWKSTPDKQALFEKLVNKQNLLNKSFEYDKDNPEAVWKGIQKDIRRPNPWFRALKYAAAILFPLVLTYLVFKQDATSPIKQAHEKLVKPGVKNAIIYLADGQVVNLQTDTSQIIKSREKLIIKRDSNSLTIDAKQLVANHSVKMNRIVTPIGTEYNLTLPDGTRVWLNAGSELEFPSRFAKTERRVSVKGELYFDVESNRNKPFIVESDGMQLKVLGTEFNVRAYEDEKLVSTTLVEGSIKVINKKGESLQIKPGRKVLVKKANAEMKEQVADIEADIAWKDGRFYFDNQAVERIMRDLSRWYNISVFYFNAEVQGRRFSVDIPRYNDITDILELMEGTGDITFEINKNTILVK